MGAAEKLPQPSMFLSYHEIRQLTGKQRRSSQKAVLDAMHITWAENGIGELVVSRRHVESKLGGAPAANGDAAPDFSSLERL